MEYIMDFSDMVYIEQGNKVYDSSLEMETLMQENCPEDVKSATDSCDVVKQKEGNEEVSSSRLGNVRKSFGFLRFPRIDTCKVTSIVEKLVNIYLNNGEIKHKKAYQKIICDMMRNLDMTVLFKNFDNHIKDVDIIENHKYEFIKLIIDYYLRTKMSYYGKCNTL